MKRRESSECISHLYVDYIQQLDALLLPTIKDVPSTCRLIFVTSHNNGVLTLRHPTVIH